MDVNRELQPVSLKDRILNAARAPLAGLMMLGGVAGTAVAAPGETTPDSSIQDTNLSSVDSNVEQAASSRTTTVDDCGPEVAGAQVGGPDGVAASKSKREASVGETMRHGAIKVSAEEGAPFCFVPMTPDKVKGLADKYQSNTKDIDFKVVEMFDGYEKNGIKYFGGTTYLPNGKTFAFKVGSDKTVDGGLTILITVGEDGDDGRESLRLMQGGTPEEKEWLTQKLSMLSMRAMVNNGTIAGVQDNDDVRALAAEPVFGIAVT
jgi:hypothetical protein